MPLYGEGILWYLVALDCIIYNILCWKKETKPKNHWLSPHFPCNKFLGLFYGLCVLWIGSALWRLDILRFR